MLPQFALLKNGGTRGTEKIPYATTDNNGDDYYSIHFVWCGSNSPCDDEV